MLETVLNEPPAYSVSPIRPSARTTALAPGSKVDTGMPVVGETAPIFVCVSVPSLMKSPPR